MNEISATSFCVVISSVIDTGFCFSHVSSGEFWSLRQSELIDKRLNQFPEFENKLEPQQVLEPYQLGLSFIGYEPTCIAFSYNA